MTTDVSVVENLHHIDHLAHGDDEVEGHVGRSLGDHLHIGIGLLHSSEYVTGDSALVQQVVTDGTDQGDVVLHVDPLDVPSVQAVELPEGLGDVVVVNEEGDCGKGCGYGVDDHVDVRDLLDDPGHHGGPVCDLRGADCDDGEVGLGGDAPE